MVDVNVYRENRAKFTIEQLRPYDGQWVAFSADGKRILASAEGLDALEDRLSRIGENPAQVGFERIVLDDDSFVGGEGR